MIPEAALGIILTASQIYWVQQAFLTGEPHGLGYTLVAIIGQESSYCQAKVNKWSRGCGGLKRSTARLYDPEVTREQLTEDNQRNLRDSLAYLQDCERKTHSWRGMVYAYHWGIPAAMVASEETIDADIYVNAIRKRMQEVKVSHE